MEENLSKMKILIEELKVIMNIGVRDEERSYPQEIIINLECECDFTKAIETDKSITPSIIKIFIKKY
jgi:Dihydroneopterin aldolase.